MPATLSSPAAAKSAPASKQLNPAPLATGIDPALIRVHMINRRLGYGATETVLQGFSGARWGKATSRFSRDYGCHFIELTLEEYEKCREDVFKAAHLSARVWEPKFVVGSGELIVDSQSRDGAAGAVDAINLDLARRERDMALADKAQAEKQLGGLREMLNGACQKGGIAEIASAAVIRLPPDVLTSPMPLPERLDYAQAIVQAAIIESIQFLSTHPPRGGETITFTTPPTGDGPGFTGDPALQKPDVLPTETITKAAQELVKSAVPIPESGVVVQEVTPVDAKMPFAKLKKIAQDEGAPWQGVKNCAALVKAITTHRDAMLQKQQDLIAAKPQGGQS